MKHPCFVPPRTGNGGEVPFENVEEAWLWGVKGVKSRIEGVRMLPGMSRVERPCEAVDVVNCVAKLRRSRRLSQQQIAILFLYGQHDVPPRVLGGNHAQAAIVWDEALNVLKSELQQKGIVAQQLPQELADA